MNEKLIDFFTYALIIGVVSGFMYLMKKKAGKKIEVNENGQFQLQLPMFYGILGGISVLFGMLWIVLPFWLSYTETEDADIPLLIMCVIAAICFISGGVFLLLYYKNHVVIFDQKNIVSTNLYGKTTEVEWQYIEDIKFSTLSGMITVKSYDKKAKLHQHLVGLITFIEEMEAQTKYTAQDLKIPIGSSKRRQ